MKRILIFVHFNPSNALSGYVLFWLKSLRPHFKRVLFVSNSPLSEQASRKAEAFADRIILRENRGFDFGGWKEAILSEGWEALSEYDSLTLMNDTGFGPLADIGQMYTEMEKREADFWGITQHRATRSGMPGTDKPVPRHIQSYFIVFNRRVTESDYFRGFWNNLQQYNTREKIIQHCEVMLTKHLEKSGFVFDTVVKAGYTKVMKPNVSELHPEYVLAEGSPFLKIKSFLQSNDPDRLKKLVKQISDYDVSFMENYFDEIHPPEKNLLVNNKTVVLHDVERKENVRDSLKTAIIFDVADADKFIAYLDLLKKTPGNRSLFVTTDSKKIRDEIENRLARYRPDFPGTTITFFEKPNGIFSFDQKGENPLSLFDMAGYFRVHGKSGSETDSSRLFMQAVQAKMVKSMNGVVQLFEEDNQLGIVLPDLPPAGNSSDNIDVPSLEKTWRAINSNKKSVSPGRYRFMISHRTGFWFRPAALMPLFNLSDSRYPEGNIGQHKIIPTGKLLNYLPVYVCWGQGYDFRILVDPGNVKSRFEWMKTSDEDSGKDSIKKSLSWRFGRTITWIPRRLVKLFRRKNH